MSSDLDGSVRALLEAPGAVIMGIVNTTPDSFSDGGQYQSRQSAVAHALQLVREGAQIVDIGGESTRPGAKPVSVEQELDRVIPVIEQLSEETEVPISIDTCKPEVMLAAVSAGAKMINDVSALAADGALKTAAEAAVPVCLMHMRGEPATMQNKPDYLDVVAQVGDFLEQKVEQCVRVGIAYSDIIVDPGIGFGKSLQHNLQLLKHLPSLRQRLNCPLLIGVSRKSLIDKALGRQLDQRLAASVGLAVQSMINGAKILRVHDVQATHDAIRMAEAVANSG